MFQLPVLLPSTENCYHDNGDENASGGCWYLREAFLFLSAYCVAKHDVNLKGIPATCPKKKPLVGRSDGDPDRMP